MKAIITVGISCSGKTTLAKQLEKENYVDVNRDFFRFNVVCPGSDWGTYKFTRAREREVTALQEDVVMAAKACGANVIISDTNLNPSTRNKWVTFLSENGFEVEIKPMPISLEDAWKRDSLRKNGVGWDVIYKQWLQWLAFVGRKQYTPDNTLPDAIIVDIDGTLATMANGRGPFEWERVCEDDVDLVVADIVEGLSLTHQIVVVSGRDGICYDETERWLVRHGIPFDMLIMRECDDRRKDSIVKEEIFWKHIAPNWNVKAVIDDRPQVVRMWYDIGVPKVVAVGNPYVEF